MWAEARRGFAQERHGRVVLPRLARTSPANALRSTAVTRPRVPSSSDPSSEGSAAPSTMIFRASTVMEAQMVRDALESEGIPSTLRNEQLTGLIGEIPFQVAWPEVWLVDGADWEDAVGVVGEYEERRKTAVVGEILCVRCGEMSPGNFELCWKCREPIGRE